MSAVHIGRYYIRLSGGRAGTIPSTHKGFPATRLRGARASS